MNQCDYSENQLHSEYRFNLTNYIVCTFFSLFLKRVSKYYIMGTIIYSILLCWLCHVLNLNLPVGSKFNIYNMTVGTRNNIHSSFVFFNFIFWGSSLEVAFLNIVYHTVKRLKKLSLSVIG